MDFTGSGAPQRISTAFISPGFFSTLQVNSVIGRLPREDEMVRGGDDRVVVLSYGYWQRSFGGDVGIINSTLTLNGQAYRVLGVMPDSFAFPSPNAEAFVPFSTIPDNAVPRIRPVRIMEVVARLKPGVTIEQARVEMNGITKHLSEQYAENVAWSMATLMPLHEAITGTVEGSLWMLLAAVSFVLLMACVNVASLLLARAAAREREMAVRVSLGATRGRILRQLVTESLVLAAAGGALGILLAVIGTRGLLLLSRGQLPRSESVGVDSSAVLFAVGVTAAAGLLFGAAPAIRASAVNLRGTLSSGSRSATGSNSRLRNALVVVQVAFAVVLAVGAGLMVTSFGKLLDVNVGFKPDHLLAVNFTISTERHGDTTWQRYYQDVIDRVRIVPGVLSAGAAQYAPFRGMGERNPFVPPGMILANGEQMPTVPTQRVSDGYFRTIGAPILEGREFQSSDSRNAPAVIVVNEAFASKFLPGGNAINSQLRMGGTAPNYLMATVVGVVADIRQSGVAADAQPLMYVSNMQSGRVKVTLVSRTRADPLTMTNSIRDAIWSLDKDQTIASVFTFSDVMNESLARPRMLTVLFATFGILGVALGALGIYGVLAYLVSQRRREIALRIALGARPQSVVGLVLGRGLALAGGGVAIGLVSALALSRFASSLLYGITATEPRSYIGVGLLLLGVAILASALPALRASRVDPLTAMQSE
ncbi:MAG: ABC transporter permease, partial [Gemmatimonadaceae bacterium]